MYNLSPRQALFLQLNHGIPCLQHFPTFWRVHQKQVHIVHVQSLQTVLQRLSRSFFSMVTVPQLKLRISANVFFTVACLSDYENISSRDSRFLNLLANHRLVSVTLKISLSNQNGY